MEISRNTKDLNKFTITLTQNEVDGFVKLGKTTGYPITMLIDKILELAFSLVKKIQLPK